MSLRRGIVSYFLFICWYPGFSLSYSSKKKTNPNPEVGENENRYQNSVLVLKLLQPSTDFRGSDQIIYGLLLDN